MTEATSRKISPPGCQEQLTETRQQLVGGRKSSRVIFSKPNRGGYSVTIDGEFLRRYGKSYTSSKGWDDLPKYVQKEGRKVLDNRMAELENATPRNNA